MALTMVQLFEEIPTSGRLNVQVSIEQGGGFLSNV